MVEQTKPQMEYRFLGNSGLKVSVFSYGNWLNSDQEGNYEMTRDSIKTCFEAGINFFDTAEGYGFGQAETLMGKAFKELGYKREELVVSTKIFWGGLGHNSRGLSRKHIMEAIKAQLQRLQMEYVDVIFCHRPDFEAPLEETCRAMSQIIENGQAFYWGTSEWPADYIAKAVELCDKLNLHKPIVEQPQYNMLVRENFEGKQRRIFSEYKYGSTIWSPLCGGILTGKYNDGNIPEGSRYDQHKTIDRIWQQYMGPEAKDKTLVKLNALADLAKELGYTQAQLALAWAISNRDVSTCILGFTRLSQVEENLKALELYQKWTDEIEKKVETILDNAPEVSMDFRKWQPMEQRRSIAIRKHQ